MALYACLWSDFLWLDGSINYMWSYLFALLFLSVYITLLRGKSLLNQTWKLILFCVFTFLFGNYSENVSFSVIFTGFLLLCITMYRQKSIRKFFIYIFPIACGALGYLILLLSPSGSAKFSENLSLSLLFKNAIEIFTEYYNACRIPLILFLYFLALRFITNWIRQRFSLRSPSFSSVSYLPACLWLQAICQSEALPMELCFFWLELSNCCNYCANMYA